MEVKVPVPVKVKEPYPVRVPFPFPYPVQQQPPPKEEKPIPPPIIQPPPTIIHNYVPESEHQIFLRPVEKKPPRKKVRYEHYDDPHPEVGYEEMEDGDRMRPISKDEYFVRNKVKRNPFGLGSTGVGHPFVQEKLFGMFGSRIPVGLPGGYDPNCYYPPGQIPTPEVGPYPPMTPTSTNFFFPNRVPTVFPPPSMISPHPLNHQPKVKDCHQICHWYSVDIRSINWSQPTIETNSQT